MSINQLVAKVFKKISILVCCNCQKYQSIVAQKMLPRFANNPKNVNIDLPRNIVNPDRIFLGNDIYLGPNSLLIALTGYPGPTMQHPERKGMKQAFDSKISIGSRVTSTGQLQVAAMSEVTIEDDVMFATNVNITDGFHGYTCIDEPYKYQEITRIQPITIKQGCWIGQNVVICPGVTIGEMTVIGANSVVTQSIPDRCIVVGAPAKVIKKWDETKEGWIAVNNQTR
jgi:acetyltransferase-like isoleucine patch superfamily enzyme